ncbi:hypothetical protein Tco_0362783 [Tanacetum coccineum]
MWKNVENIPSFVPRPAYVPTGNRNRPTSVPAGRPFSAGSRNRPTSVPAGRPFPTGWHNLAARPMTRPKGHYFQQFSRPGSYNQMAMDEGRWGTAVKTSPGTQDTNNHAGPQDDSDSESDEQLIVVPSFPSNHFSGPEVNPASDTVESTSDYAEELARLQRQEYEANSAATDTWNIADMVPAVCLFLLLSIPCWVAPHIDVDPAPTRRVHIVHPISQIIGDISSPVLTRGSLKKSKFGESALAGYVHDQQRNNHTDYLHSLNDPDWVEYDSREVMQPVCSSGGVEAYAITRRKNCIGTKWILKNKRDARCIVVQNKARLVAQVIVARGRH